MNFREIKTHTEHRNLKTKGTKELNVCSMDTVLTDVTEKS